MLRGVQDDTTNEPLGAEGAGATALSGSELRSSGCAAGVLLSAALRQGRIAAADVVRQGTQVICIVALIAAGAGLVPLLATSIPAAALAFAVTAHGVHGGLPRPALAPRRWIALLTGMLP